jgi:hypothetical protein
VPGNRAIGVVDPSQARATASARSCAINRVIGIGFEVDPAAL